MMSATDPGLAAVRRASGAPGPGVDPVPRAVWWWVALATVGLGLAPVVALAVP